MLQTYIGRTMVSSNCAVYDCKQNRLIKWQEASGDFKDTICKLNITTSFELLLMKQKGTKASMINFFDIVNNISAVFNKIKAY